MSKFDGILDEVLRTCTMVESDDKRKLKSSLSVVRQEHYIGGYKVMLVEEFNFETAKENGVEYREDVIGGVHVIFPVKSGVSEDDIDDSDKTIIINQDDLDMHCSFEKDNEAIREFASQNADQMFFILGIAIATQGIPWHEFQQVYPVYVAYIKESNGDLTNISNIIGLDGKKHKAGKYFYKGMGLRMLNLWEKRNLIYEDIYEDGLINDPFELFVYLVRNVNGFSAVKAGFAVQLLTGHMGCIDNINTDVYGIPVSIGTISSGNPNFMGTVAFDAKSKRAKTNKEINSSNLTKGGRKVIEEYIKFLKVIAKLNDRNGPMAESGMLWDDWVSLASIKALYSQTHKQIALKTRDGRTILMPTYKNTKDLRDSGWADELRSHMSDDDPYAGSKISRQHYTIPRDAVDIDDATSRVSTKPMSAKNMNKIKRQLQGGDLDKFRGRKR